MCRDTECCGAAPLIRDDRWMDVRKVIRNLAGARTDEAAFLAAIADLRRALGIET